MNSRRGHYFSVQMTFGGQTKTVHENEEQGESKEEVEEYIDPEKRYVPNDDLIMGTSTTMSGQQIDLTLVYNDETVDGSSEPGGKTGELDRKENEDGESYIEPTLGNLVKAIQRGLTEVVETLLKQGVSVNAEYQHKTPLFYAVESSTPDNLKIIKLLIDKVDDVKFAPDDRCMRNCPFHHAAFLNRRDVVDYFLDELNLPVNLQDEDGLTPVMAACKSNHMDLIRYLMEERHTDILARMDDGSAYRYLVEKRGADILARMDDGSACIHIGATRAYLDVVQYCIEHGEDVKARQKDGTSALMLAACRGVTAIATYLIQKGADVHVKDSDGWTALHSAACYNYPDIVDALVLAGALINQRSHEGYTPVQAAAEADRAKSILSLFKHGADLNCVNKHGLSPLTESLNRYNTYSIWALLDCGVRKNTAQNMRKFQEFLMSTSLHPKIDVRAAIRLLFDAGVKFDAHNMLALGPNACLVHHNIPMRRFYRHVAHPYSLQMWCRLVIRATIRKPISEHVTQLPLPDKLRDNIVLIEYVRINKMHAEFGYRF